MPDPRHNLPSLEGQRNYMSLKHDSEIRDCNHARETDMNGFDVAMLRDNRNHVLLTMDISMYRVRSESMNTHVTESYTRQSRKKGKYKLYDDAVTRRSKNYMARLQIASESLYYAFNPVVDRLDHVKNLIHIWYLQNIVTDQKEYETHIHTIKQMIDTKENQFNRINRKRARILLNSFDVLQPKYSETDLHAYINNTYVNVVYGCGTICAQSVLSDAQHMTYHYDREKYTLMCLRRIFEEKGFMMGNTVTAATGATDTNVVTNDSLYRTEHATCSNTLCDNNVQIAFSASMVGGSIIMLFIAHSNNIVARSIRHCFSRVGNAISGLCTTANSMGRVPAHERTTVHAEQAEFFDTVTELQTAS